MAKGKYLTMYFSLKELEDFEKKNGKELTGKAVKEVLFSDVSFIERISEIQRKTSLMNVYFYSFAKSFFSKEQFEKFLDLVKEKKGEINLIVNRR
ncbi:MAG: hypothetical protein ABIN05_07930 [candidate division WOR-3 bacterium]